MRIVVIAMIIATTIVLHPNMTKAQSVSVIIAEQTVNDFLTAVGPVSGAGSGAQNIAYTWTVKEPVIDFEPETADFRAKITVKTRIITFDDEVKGRLAVDYDATNNKIRMQVVEARFPISVKVLGRKIQLATIDIGQYYNPKFEFNGPEPVQQQVELDVGNGEIRLVGVTPSGRQIKTEKDQLRVSVDLAYQPL